MSRRYSGYEYENDWLALGRKVWFDGPSGGRMYGEIIRTSSNPTYFHVWSDGQRYEVDMHEDRMSQTEEPLT